MATPSGNAAKRNAAEIERVAVDICDLLNGLLRQVNLLIAGPRGVGKSTLLRQLQQADGEPITTNPAAHAPSPLLPGAETVSICSKVRCTTFDTSARPPGQREQSRWKRLRRLKQHFAARLPGRTKNNNGSSSTDDSDSRPIDAVVFVLDLSSTRTVDAAFNDLKALLDMEVLQGGMPFLVLCNNSTQLSGRDDSRLNSIAKEDSKWRWLKWPGVNRFYPCKIAQGKGYFDAFGWLAVRLFSDGEFVSTQWMAVSEHT